MSTLPKEHEKYPLLLRTRNTDFEVFAYPSLCYLNDMGEDGLEPYGYKSLDDYLAFLDERRRNVPEEKKRIYNRLKKLMVEMNNKEEGSVCLYTGETEIGDRRMPPFIQGRAYYWPCSKKHPEYQGIIDEEEWTAYWYPIKADEWEILEDPTGMVTKMISEEKCYVIFKNKRDGHTKRYIYKNATGKAIFPGMTVSVPSKDTIKTALVVKTARGIEGLGASKIRSLIDINETWLSEDQAQGYILALIDEYKAGIITSTELAQILTTFIDDNEIVCAEESSLRRVLRDYIPVACSAVENVENQDGELIFWKGLKDSEYLLKYGVIYKDIKK